MVRIPAIPFFFFAVVTATMLRWQPVMETVQLRSGTPQSKMILRGLNEGVSSEENEDDWQVKVEWLRETVRFISKTIKWLTLNKERHGEKIN